MDVVLARFDRLPKIVAVFERRVSMRFVKDNEVLVPTTVPSRNGSFRILETYVYENASGPWRRVGWYSCDTDILHTPRRSPPQPARINPSYS